MKPRPVAWGFADEEGSSGAAAALNMNRDDLEDAIDSEMGEVLAVVDFVVDAATLALALASVDVVWHGRAQGPGRVSGQRKLAVARPW